MPRPEHEHHLHFRVSEGELNDLSLFYTAPSLQERAEVNNQPETTQPHDRGEASAKTVLVAASLAVSAGFAYMTLKDIGDVNIGFDIPNVASTGEPKMEGEIDPLTYRTEGRFDMSTNSQIEVGVGVTGFKEGYSLDVFGVSDSHFNKKIFGDVLLGSDRAVVNESLAVYRENGEIVEITATINAMDIFHPRVDMGELKNYIGIDADDTQEETAKKEREFKEDRSHYDASGGFECTICSTDSMALKDGANFVTQYAISVDGHQPDIIFEATERYRLDTISQIASTYGVDPSLVKIDVVYAPGTDPFNPPTPKEVTAIYQQRMKEIYDKEFSETGQYLFQVKPELRVNDDGSEYVFAKLIGNVELKVQLSGITYSDEIRGLIIQNIEEHAGPTVVGPETITLISAPPGMEPIIITSTTRPFIGPIFNPNGSQTTPPTNALQPTVTTAKIIGPPWPGNTSTTEG